MLYEVITRPAMCRNSSTLSKTAESLLPSITMGKIFFRSSPKGSDVHNDLITRGLSIISDAYLDQVARAGRAAGSYNFV